MGSYIVQAGDTLYSIARNHGQTTRAFVEANPGILERPLVVGEVLQLPNAPEGHPSIETNGYIDSTTDDAMLLDVLPYFTYLSIFGHRITIDGYLVGTNNTQMIQTARAARVAPMMVVSNTTENGFYSRALIHAVLTNPAASQRLIDGILSTLQQQDYYGVNLDMEFIAPEDFPLYVRFLQTLSSVLQPYDYRRFIVVRIITVLEQQETLSRMLSPGDFMHLSDRFVIHTNEWACNARLDLPLMDLAQQAIDYATSLVPGSSIIIGIPNCCFRWSLPYKPNTAPHFLTAKEAEALSRMTGAYFQMDSQTGASYFQYADTDGITNMVWCPNRCSNQTILSLVRIYHLGGVSYRMVNDFSITDYQSMQAMFDIKKVL